MNKTFFRITLSVVFAAFLSPWTFGQDPPTPPEGFRQDPYAFKGEESFILESPEDHIVEEREKAIRFAVERVLDPLGKEKKARGYKSGDQSFVGEKGRLDKAQISAVKAFAAPFLNDPRHVATDDEKEALGDAFALSGADLDAKVVSFEAAFLAKLGRETQRRLGIKVALGRLSSTRQRLAAYAQNPRKIEQESQARQEVEKLDRLIADVPFMDDSETYLFHKVKTGFGVSNNNEYDVETTIARLIKPEQRIVLPESCDFIAFLKRSIELEENGEALAALASEYEARGNYDKALELWKRAKTAKVYSVVEQAKLFFPGFHDDSIVVDGFNKPIRSDADLGDEEPKLRENVDKYVDAVIAELEKTPAIRVAADGSESEGLRVSMTVFSRDTRALKTTFYQIDLAPFLAKTREPAFTDAPHGGELFVNLVAEGVQELFRSETPISSFATEVQSSVAPVAVVEGREYAPVRSNLTFNVEKSGAYLIRVVDANAENDEVAEKNAAYALAFANRYAFAFQYNRLVVTDVLTGKPYSNRELELLFIKRSIPEGAESAIVSTDASGYLKPKSRLDHWERLVAFAFDDDEDDRSVSFFDSRLNPYAPHFANDALILGQQSHRNTLVLATNQPVYAPGDTVEFVGQTTYGSGYSFDPGVPQGIRVYQKQRPLPPEPDGPSRGMGMMRKERKQDPPREIASVEVEVDKTGGFSGSFKIPEDAEPGEYVFAEGHFKTGSDDKPAVFDEHISTLFISTRADDAEPTPAATPKVKPVFPSPAPFVELEFESPVYSSKASDVANFVVRSSNPDASVVIEKNGSRAVGQQGGYVAPDNAEVKSVELRDGVASFSCSLADADARYFILTVNASYDNKAQTSYYLVGARNKQFVRDAALEFPEKVKPGEKVRLTAKFAPLEDGDPLFGGRASLVLFDAKRDLTPCDDFSIYLAEVQPESRFLMTQDYSTLKLMRPTAPPKRRAERKSIADRAPQRPSRFCYEYYADETLPLPWDVDIDYNVEERRRLKRPARSEFVLEEVPKIPASASPDSVLKTTTAKERVDSLSFEFDAPKTPGTYRIVFRAFDREKECATFVKRDIVVE